MRERNPEILLNTISIFSTPWRLLTFTWTPTDESESEDEFLTERPRNLVANNLMMDVPFISGVVDNEGPLILAGEQ